MYRYVKATDTHDYRYLIYRTAEDKSPFYSDRASSYAECFRLYQEYKKRYPNCVISIYNLSSGRWVAWKASSL